MHTHTHTHTHTPFTTRFPAMLYHRVLMTIPCAPQWDLVCPSVYKRVRHYPPLPTASSPSPRQPPPIRSLHPCHHRWVRVGQVLDSPHGWCGGALVSLWLSPLGVASSGSVCVPRLAGAPSFSWLRGILVRLCSSLSSPVHLSGNIQVVFVSCLVNSAAVNVGVCVSV